MAGPVKNFSPFPPPWTGGTFPASTRTHDPNNQLPDFPDGGGDREQGKFRPSTTPRLTQIAVTNDDGTQIGSALIPLFDDSTLTMYLKAIAYGVAILTNRTIDDLLDEMDSTE